MKSLIFKLLLLLLLSGIIFCDEVIEGTKNISFNIELTNIDSYPDYFFIAFPVNNSRGAPQIEAIKLEENNTLHLVCKYGGPVIYAIKKNLLKPDDIKFGEVYNREELKKIDSFFTKNKNMISSGKIYCISQVDKSEPYSSITDYYIIESVTSDTLKLKREKIIRKDEDGKIIDELKGDIKGDLLNGSKKNSSVNYIYYSIPLLAIIALVVFIIVRKKKT